MLTVNNNLSYYKWNTYYRQGCFLDRCTGSHWTLTIFCLTEETTEAKRSDVT